jgi:hypothetical protein
LGSLEGQFSGSSHTDIDAAQLVTFTLRHATSFEFGEYFAVADYDSARELLDDEDLITFRSALGRGERDTPLNELHPADTFTGLRAVVLQRLHVGGFDAAHEAARLFNNIIENALDGVVDTRNPRSHIRVQTAPEFAPWFVGRLISAVESLKRIGYRNPFEVFVGERFQSLKPVLDGFQRLMERGDWPRDDLALGRFLLIVDHFNAAVEKEWGL